MLRAGFEPASSARKADRIGRTTLPEQYDRATAFRRSLPVLPYTRKVCLFQPVEQGGSRGLYERGPDSNRHRPVFSRVLSQLSYRLNGSGEGVPAHLVVESCELVYREASTCSQAGRSCTAQTLRMFQPLAPTPTDG